MGCGSCALCLAGSQDFKGRESWTFGHQSTRLNGGISYTLLRFARLLTTFFSLRPRSDSFFTQCQPSTSNSSARWSPVLVSWRLPVLLAEATKQSRLERSKRPKQRRSVDLFVVAAGLEAPQIVQVQRWVARPGHGSCRQTAVAVPQRPEGAARRGPWRIAKCVLVEIHFLMFYAEWISVDCSWGA
jgi:hypothetical protein